MTIPTVPVGVTPVDYSFTLNGSAQSPLAAAYPAVAPAGQYPRQTGGVAGANPNRTFLFMQAPQTEPITYSFTNPTPNDPANTLGAGCYILGAGQTFSFGASVIKSPLYINGGAAGSGLNMTLQEC